LVRDKRCLLLPFSCAACLPRAGPRVLDLQAATSSGGITISSAMGMLVRWLLARARARPTDGWPDVG
jgi:hypothetical protein